MSIIGRIGPRRGAAEVRGFGGRIDRLKDQVRAALDTLPEDIEDGRLKDQRDNILDELDRLADMVLCRALRRGDARWVSDSGRAAP